MARLTSGPKYRIYRAEGADLGLKGKRSLSSKALNEQKMSTRPGANGAKRARKSSDFGTQLRAKQKVKRLYLVAEKQFKNYFLKAKRSKGQVGDNLLNLLEHRLDNVIFKSGLSLSKDHARQLVSHRHIMVNGKYVNIPSYQVEFNDVITVRPKIISKEASLLRFKDDNDFTTPSWLDLSKPSHTVKVIGQPDLDELKKQVNINLIIEYYSR